MSSTAAAVTIDAPPPPLTPDQLARSCLPLAHRLADEAARHNPGADYEALLSAANLGLAKAALAFDPHRGARFVTLAHLAVTNAIRDELTAMVRRARKGEVSLDGRSVPLRREQRGREPFAREPSPDVILEQAEQEAQEQPCLPAHLWRVLDEAGLGEDEVAVVELLAAGERIEDIARDRGVGVPAVRNWASRARRVIEEAWGE